MTNPAKRRFSVAALLLPVVVAVLLAGCGKPDATGSEDRLERAKRLIGQGNYQEAFLELNQALAMAPRDPEVHLNLAWLYLYTDDEASARRELAKVEELAPNRAEVFHLRGGLQAYRAAHEAQPDKRRKAYQAAIESFNQALSRDARNHMTYFDLAGSLAATGRHEAAVETLDRGFEHIPPNDLDSQINFQVASCAAYAELQLFDEAIEDCGNALEYTRNPVARQRIRDMIENMRLMNPRAVEQAETRQKSAETPGTGE